MMDTKITQALESLEPTLVELLNRWVAGALRKGGGRPRRALRCGGTADAGHRHGGHPRPGLPGEGL